MPGNHLEAPDLATRTPARQVGDQAAGEHTSKARACGRETPGGLGLWCGVGHLFGGGKQTLILYD